MHKVVGQAAPCLTAAIALPSAQVAAAIAALDSRRLQGAIVRELQANMPEEAELAALHAYLDCGGGVADLGPAEQLFAALKGVPRLDQKLQVCTPCGREFRQCRMAH